MIPADTVESKEPLPLNLRPYQQELIKDAQVGLNSIIVAPTGSGKTHVAMAIAKVHILPFIGTFTLYYCSCKYLR